MLKKLNTYFILFALFLTFVTSCNRHVVSSKELIIYPSPPDTPRIQFLTSFSNSANITGKRSALQKTVIGDEQLISVGKPYGIATVNGKIFICDASLKGMLIVDLAKKTFTPFVPGGRGQLKLPINCFVHEDRLYITDVQRNEVVIFDQKFNYITAIGKSNTIENFRPMDVCASGKKIWITNPKTHQVLLYEKEILENAKFISGNINYVNLRENYKLLKTFPDTTYGNDEYLNNPINISYQNGKIFVTDFGDFKIKIFTEDGAYLGCVGQYGNSLGQFVRPKGTAIDKDNNLFVVDAGFENVQIFNNQGKLLMYFGGPYKGPGDMWLPAKVLIDYENLKYYKKWVSPDYELSYLIFVTNQYGPDKINVYGAIKPLLKRNTERNEKK